MARKRLSKVKLVKALARERVGQIKPAKVIPDKRRKIKHKKKDLKEIEQ